jgi:RNase adaptor protein for sRNA GlmZ degradation
MVEMVLITGLSGAGKTSTLKIFEDYGYFAIDNLPLNFLESLAKLMFNTKFSKIALGMDIRSLFNCSVDEFVESIKNIKKLKEIKLTVIYVTAKKEIILERFRNTKRTHPLMKEGLNLNQCIDKEQELMEKIASISDYVIDSSDLSINKLRSKLKSALIQREGIEISITSFGYKYGIPLDADLVLDVRMLPNPFYVEDLKKFTGHDKDIKEFTKKTLQQAKNDAGVKAYRDFGTPMLVSINNSIKGFPSKYWHQGTFDGWEKINAETMKDVLNTIPKACPKCFMACGKLSEVIDGRHKGLKIEGPEYETIYAFGGLCLIDDIREIAYLNDLCDNLGMDTITTGNLVAFTMEACELGKIDYKIKYGDADKAAELIQMIAFRKDIGNILAEGIKYAAEIWDMEKIAIHVKGLEPAGYEPRILKGMSLAYATSPRGACHLRSTFYKAELAGLIDKNQIEGKANLFIEFENRLVIHDCLILCRFYRDLYMWDELGEIIYITTGLKLNRKELEDIAANVINLTRYFNQKCGLSKKDDTLPARFFNESLNEGKDFLKREDFEKMLSEYYMLRKWDENGLLREIPL